MLFWCVLFLKILSIFFCFVSVCVNVPFACRCCGSNFKKKKFIWLNLKSNFNLSIRWWWWSISFTSCWTNPKLFNFLCLKKENQHCHCWSQLKNLFVFVFFLITILHRKFCSPIHPFHSFFTHNVCVSSLSFVFYHLISIWVIITITTTHTWHMHTILKHVINQ